MTNFSRCSSHGHHGSKRRELSGRQEQDQDWSLRVVRLAPLKVVTNGCYFTWNRPLGNLYSKIDNWLITPSQPLRSYQGDVFFPQTFHFNSFKQNCAHTKSIKM